ncbi:MBOAT family O-acyltransferase [Halarcobacter sp.]|uniref:MBOAT family O-acyltransferase n=1 Tax=Halarcobacter sp. TaxID=2321133 RepID=UPI0029F5401F|nr:MBOAT family O-acyltransferase [Halarcobacter sp.]
MLFNSYEFIFVFMPITFFVYYFLLSKRLVVGAKGFLVFASLFFYSWWNPIYLPLILSSMLFNYVIGNSLNENFKKIKITKKTLLTIGVIANLALLGYFKYADFFINNINMVTNGSVELLHLALPLAISFFTFQQIAYLVDSYRGETSEYDFLNYALFVTFFPQLIAGPIVHHKEMMPQFASRWNLVKNYKHIAMGLFIFSIGLFKKVIIADQFAIWATAGFDNAVTLELFEAWATSLSYTFQLYFDFSGYCDMAVGAALLFNIKLPINFNSPYKSLDIQDFWRRWHVTLGRFMRDYIYIPLGGNRKGNIRGYTNLFTVAVVSGFWHGAGWTFIAWGALHGIALVTHRIWKDFGFNMNKYLAWFITFNFINITWVFFRALSWEDAVKVLKGMVGLNGIVMSDKYAQKLEFLKEHGVEFGQWLIHIDGNKSFTWIAVALFIVLYFQNSNFLYKKSPKLLYLSVVLFLTSIYFGIVNQSSEFIYFNF